MLIRANWHTIADATDVEGIGFQFEDDENIGNFQIQTTDSSHDETIIETNGDSGFPPFFTTDYSEGSGNDSFNEISYTWDASLIIDQNTTGTVFDLYSLCSSTGSLVGVAKITFNGYTGLSPYDVNITFADYRNGNGEKYFYLMNANETSFIPFTLELHGLELHNGQGPLGQILNFLPLSMRRTSMPRQTPKQHSQRLQGSMPISST